MGNRGHRGPVTHHQTFCSSSSVASSVDCLFASCLVRGNISSSPWHTGGSDTRRCLGRLLVMASSAEPLHRFAQSFFLWISSLVLSNFLATPVTATNTASAALYLSISLWHLSCYFLLLLYSSPRLRILNPLVAAVQVCCWSNE